MTNISETTLALLQRVDAPVKGDAARDGLVMQDCAPGHRHQVKTGQRLPRRSPRAALAIKKKQLPQKANQDEKRDKGDDTQKKIDGEKESGSPAPAKAEPCSVIWNKDVGSKPCSCKLEAAKRISKQFRQVRKGNMLFWLEKHGLNAAAKMNAEERALYHKMFQILDADNSGSLEVEEMTSLGEVGLGSGHLRKDILRHATQDGEIDLNAFLSIIEESEARWQQQLQIRRRRARRNTSNLVSSPQRRRSVALRRMSGAHIDAPLPFYLFLPAVSRRKNIDFVMSLSLEEDGVLPHPVGEYMPGTAEDYPIRTLVASAPKTTCTCNKASRPTKLVEIAKDLAVDG
mmetsp:Transcript_15318/g.28168  ORF Transcript_15318/g.28168 Transcript_15318/m.28168 type:complete len:344 (-) Transcript_15318:300-1331(-)